MSCIIVVSPVIIAGWPAIAAAVTGAVAAMGFYTVTNPAGGGGLRVELPVEESEILRDADESRPIVIARGGIRAIFSRDERGALKMCIEGNGQSRQRLKQIGRELIDRVTQQYVYHRLVTELKQRNMVILDEEITADRTVKIRVLNP